MWSLVLYLAASTGLTCHRGTNVTSSIICWWCPLNVRAVTILKEPDWSDTRSIAIISRTNDRNMAVFCLSFLQFGTETPGCDRTRKANREWTLFLLEFYRLKNQYYVRRHRFSAGSDRSHLALKRPTAPSVFVKNRGEKRMCRNLWFCFYQGNRTRTKLILSLFFELLWADSLSCGDKRMIPETT